MKPVPVLTQLRIFFLILLIISLTAPAGAAEWDDVPLPGQYAISAAVGTIRPAEAAEEAAGPASSMVCRRVSGMLDS